MKTTIMLKQPFQSYKFTNHVFIKICCLLFAIGILSGCGNNKNHSSPDANLSMQSAAFKKGAMIPVTYTCDGQNISPPVQWSNVPDKTQTFAITLVDPDAPSGSFTHWMLFNIPATQRTLNKNIPDHEQLKNGAKHGQNDFGDVAYGGPCPPSGTTHKYVLTLYALDDTLGLDTGVSRQDLLNAVKAHVLQKAVLKDSYKRP